MKNIFILEKFKKDVKDAGAIMFKYIVTPMICVGMNYIEAKIEISKIYDDAFIKSLEDIKECWGLK